MVLLTDLPAEILCNIVLNLSYDYSDLARCCLVCRALMEIAIPTLYAQLDLNIEEEDKWAGALEKQEIALRSVAENPKLGSFVTIFYNSSTYSNDATAQLDQDLLIAAAKNMTSLRRAHLESNILSIHILHSLKLYRQLTALSINGLNPESFIWDGMLTNLTSLTWAVPVLPYAHLLDPRLGGDALLYMINVVELTCPLLESLDLDIKYPQRSGQSYVESKYRAYKVPSERFMRHIERNFSKLPLDRLRHFGIRDGLGWSHQDIFQTILREFIGDHHSTLTSLLFPIGAKRNRQELDSIISLCDLTPRLKDLALVRDGDWASGSLVEAEEYLYTLKSKLDAHGNSIERFTMTDIGSPFTKDIGQIFYSWKNLKYLRLGDRDNSDGPYDNDGKIDFESYDLISFIRELPSCLEQLIMEVNGDNLVFNDDLALQDGDDFDKVCLLGEPIFTTLRRLRSCDICAWINDQDLGVNFRPEKAVHWRRLTHTESERDYHRQQGGNKMKELWTSRMNSIYQDGQTIEHSHIIIKLGDEDEEFEGDDATEIWWDKTAAGCEVRNGRTKEMNESGYISALKSWPDNWDEFASHPLYRRFHYMNRHNPVL